MIKSKKIIKKALLWCLDEFSRNRTGREVQLQWAWLIPAITAAAGLVSTWLGKKSDQNQQTDFYNKQRADNLTDMNSQNEYNSPQSQMERLRKAGLNPHMVYGSGNSVVASAAPKEATQGRPVDRPDYSAPISQGLSMYQDIKMQETQLDNLKAQKQVYDQDALLKAAQTASTAMQTARGSFELNQARLLQGSAVESATLGVQKQKMDLQNNSSLFPYSLEAAKIGNERTKQSMDATTQQMSIDRQKNLREAAANSTSIKEALSRMLTMEQQRAQMLLQNAKTGADTREANTRILKIGQEIQNLDKDAALKQLDIDLKRKGVQPNDAMYFRVLARIWQEKYSAQNSADKHKLDSMIQKGNRGKTRF